MSLSHNLENQTHLVLPVLNFSDGAEISQKIQEILIENSIPFEHLRHVVTPTSEDSARVRNTKLSEGVKSIILVGKLTDKNYQFNFPSQYKLDLQKVAYLVGEKCVFESPERIKSKFGLEIGGVPPFGKLFGIETYFDKTVLDETRSSFNCGLRTESLILNSQNLVDLIKPKLDSFILA